MTLNEIANYTGGRRRRTRNGSRRDETCPISGGKSRRGGRSRRRHRIGGRSRHRKRY